MRVTARANYGLKFTRARAAKCFSHEIVHHRAVREAINEDALDLVCAFARVRCSNHIAMMQLGAYTIDI